MHLEVEQLRALATLAEELNFTRAARRLGRKLVERSTRSVQLTDAGLELLARAKPILDAQFSRGSSG